MKDILDKKDNRKTFINYHTSKTNIYNFNYYILLYFYF